MSLEKTRDSIGASAPGRFLLLMLSGLYLLAVRFREALYSAGILAGKKVSRPVICFGNISAGGTGKTSTVIMAAAELKKMKKSAAIIMRGYKRKRKTGSPFLVGTGENSSSDFSGDEAALVHTALKEQDIPVIVDPDRAKAAAFAVEKFNPDVILMDDGFQHFSLERDLNVVLINASAGHGESIIPLGNLREPFSALKRAHLAMLTHCENASEKKLDELRERIKKANPELPVVESMHVPECFLDALSRKRFDVYSFKGADAVSLSAIGDPASFENMLSGLGVKLKKAWRFADHHEFTLEDLKAVEDLREGLPLITTYKDFVRFPRNWEKVISSKLYIFSIKVSFLSNGYKIFLKKLMETAK
ncbi:MAG: tetraacyldisaccharide 4'-kinase [Elusimicrobia bacterium CG08_land_8_20_14_0_20_51_18]|nr:MAG: tetraacyldisaccharide 4'-kinase [Elusimicrobia bacterium CG08_land_8_20_14_0_20_51_18]